MKVLINSKYEALSPFIHSIPEIFDNTGRVIYESRNVIKVLELGSLQVNIKRYHPPRGINAYVYSLGIRQPKGLRAFTYPSILLSKGIDTPEPIAYIEQRHAGLLGYSYLVTVQSHYEHTMYEFGDASQGSYEEYAVQFARYTADMHDKQVMHLDYSPGNILFTQDGQGVYHFTLVDINRMHFGVVNMDQGLSNFKRLWGPKHFFILLIREYARIRGYEIEESVRYALEVRRRFWLHYSKKHPVFFKLEL